MPVAQRNRDDFGSRSTTTGSGASGGASFGVSERFTSASQFAAVSEGSAPNPSSTSGAADVRALKLNSTVADASAARKEAVVAVLGQFGKEKAMRDLPLLATLLNAPTQETAYTARLGVAQRDNRRLELLARLLSAKADVAPTLVLLDNTSGWTRPAGASSPASPAPPPPGPPPRRASSSSLRCEPATLTTSLEAPLSPSRRGR